MTHCLSELKSDSEGLVAPKEYISQGNWSDIDFDAYNGVSYWRLRDNVTSTRIESSTRAGIKVEITVPLKLVFSVNRDKLTADDAYSFDRIRETIEKQFNVDNGALRTQLGASKLTITTPTSNGDSREVWEGETSETGTHEPKYEVVFGSIDIDIVIQSDGSCLSTECDAIDPQILHTFDFCKEAVVAELTDYQVECLEAALCGTCADATVQNDPTTPTWSDTVASGGTMTLDPVRILDSDGVTEVEPNYKPTGSGRVFECTQSGAPPSDPSSFSDPLILFRSDKGQTLVDDKLDIWEDQSGNDYHASAETALNQVALSANLGVYGFRDLIQANSTDFVASGLPTASITQYTVDCVIKRYVDTKHYTFMVGDISINSPFCMVIGLEYIQVIFKTPTTYAWVLYRPADFPSGTNINEALKLTFLFDGTQSTVDTKCKMYISGILMASSQSGGSALPSSVDNSTGEFYVSSSTDTSGYGSTFMLGYTAYWERLFTTQEIADNNDWKNETWD